GLDAAGALRALQGDAVLTREMQAVPAPDGLELVEHRAPARGRRGGEFGEAHRGTDSVLVPTGRPHRVAERLLEAEDEARPGLPLEVHGLVGDPLEAGQHLGMARAVVLGDATGAGRGDDG